MTRRDRERRAVDKAGRQSWQQSSLSTAGAMVPGGARDGAAVNQALQGGATAMLEYLSRRDDGWLRWIPSRDGQPIYVKWKFVRGPFERKYVMSVAQAWQVEYALQILLVKLAKVDAGDVSDLANDTYYNHLADEVPRD